MLNEDDVGWRLIVQNWLARQADTNRAVLTNLCDCYIQDSLDFLHHEKVIRPENAKRKTVLGYNHSHGQLQQAVSLANTTMVQNLIAIFEVNFAFFKVGRKLGFFQCSIWQTEF